MSIQAQVINLMVDLQQEKRLSYLFIAHDLAVVEHISHRIAVMYLGRIVEYADKETLFRRPLHPYTEALLAAVPIPDPKIKRQKRVLQGDVPSPINPPPGCAFHTRCPYAMARCKEEAPRLVRGCARQSGRLPSARRGFEPTLCDRWSCAPGVTLAHSSDILDVQDHDLIEGQGRLELCDGTFDENLGRGWIRRRQPFGS